MFKQRAITWVLAAVMLCALFVPLPATLPVETVGTANAQVGALPSNIRTKLQAGGVNLMFGFYDSTGYLPNDYDDDLPLIAASGAGHVRIPISWDVLFGSASSSTIVTSRYNDIVAFVNRARNSGLATIIDIHNTRQRIGGGTTGTWNEDYMVDIGTSAGRARHLAGMTALAQRLYQDGVDRNWFVLQPANEPIFGNGDEAFWYNHQAQLIPALRSACPDCVLFAMGNDWQGVETYSYFTPLPSWYDQRIIWDFHFYEPMPLSHCQYQGGNNGCPGLTFPGTYATWRSNNQPVLWNSTSISNILSGLMSWRSSNNVVIHFSEIGTARGLADGTRSAYLGAIATILRNNTAGFTAYDWNSDGFGIYPGFPLTINALFGGAPQPTPTNTPTVTPGGPTLTPTPTNTVGPTATNTPTATATPPPGLVAVTSMTLINSDTEQPYAGWESISNNSTLTLSQGYYNYAFRANANGAVSVEWRVNGSFYSTDNASPYALDGDVGGNFYPSWLGNGTWTLTATPYTGANASGVAGTPLTLTITVREFAPTATPAAGTPTATFTNTPTLTRTPTPTNTPGAGTPTNTPAPTATNTPTATATFTVTPTRNPAVVQIEAGLAIASTQQAATAAHLNNLFATRNAVSTQIVGVRTGQNTATDCVRNWRAALTRWYATGQISNLPLCP